MQLISVKMPFFEDCSVEFKDFSSTFKGPKFFMTEFKHFEGFLKQAMNPDKVHRWKAEITEKSYAKKLASSGGTGTITPHQYQPS